MAAGAGRGTRGAVDVAAGSTRHRVADARGATVDGAVLAHGGHDDAIVQFDGAEPDWRKQDAWQEMMTAR